VSQLLGTERSFRRVRYVTAKKFPFIARVRLYHCNEADQAHQGEWRLFMHTGHLYDAVCVSCLAEDELYVGEKLGMFLHEMGHLIAVHEKMPHHMKHLNPPATPDEVQMEADIVVARDLGFKTFTYNQRSLQWVAPSEFKKKEAKDVKLD